MNVTNSTVEATVTAVPVGAPGPPGPPGPAAYGSVNGKVTFVAADGVLLFGPHQCMDSNNVSSMLIADPITKNVKTAWAQGNEKGAFDGSGAILASATLHCFAITKSDGTDGDYLTSLSPDAPLLPDDYVLFRRIFSTRLDSESKLMMFTHFADEVIYAVPIHDMDGVLSVGDTDLLLTVPTGIPVKANFRVNATATPPAYLTVRSIYEGSFPALAGNVDMILTTDGVSAVRSVWTDVNGKVILHASASVTGIFINTTGYIDLRGSQ